MVLRLLTLGTTLLALASQVFAQEPFPSRTIRIIVPFTPGSVTDVMGRSVSDKLAANLGQPVIVENRPGAGGTIGISQVAKSAADGYTLVVVSAGYAVNPVIYDNLPYDSAKDLAGVIPLGNLPSVLFVSPAIGVKSVQELITLAKAKPGTLNYPSAGIGSASHVNAEKFLAVTGIKAVHVPLKGAPEMITETMAGRTQFGTVGISAAQSAIRDGRLIALAVSGKKRAPNLPDVPTVAEAGGARGRVHIWDRGVPPGPTPPAHHPKLHGAVGRGPQSPDVRARHAQH